MYKMFPYISRSDFRLYQVFPMVQCLKASFKHTHTHTHTHSLITIIIVLNDFNQ